MRLTRDSLVQSKTNPHRKGKVHDRAAVCGDVVHVWWDGSEVGDYWGDTAVAVNVKDLVAIDGEVLMDAE